MANFLARWTMAWVPKTESPRPVRGENLEAAEPKPETQGDRIAIFTNPKALTFPIVVGLVKGAWEALKALPAPWILSPWVPFVLCLVFGLAITIASLVEEKPKGWGWVIGLIVGFLNSCVIFGAVMGIPGARPSTG